MKKITGTKKLLLYSLSGLGVNMLGIIIGSYLCDALMVEGFDVNVENWTYLNRTLVAASLWAILIAVAKILDGFIDIPFAAWTDKLKTRWGKRRPAILVGFVPMLVAYLLFLLPLTTEKNSILNTIWFGSLLCIFYCGYTMTMVAYYATFSEIVDNEADRLKIANFKTTFDVMYYVLGFALIPMLVGSMNIRMIALLFLPLSFTMLIPMFMIKEKSTLDEDVLNDPDKELLEEKHVGLVESVKYTIKNRNFVIWLAVYFTLQFSVQLFLDAQNVYYSGVTKLSGGQISIFMACAFAPVPFTLILYNYLVKRYGLKYGYIFSLIAYMSAMLVLAFSGANIIKDTTTRLIFACVGAVFSSFGTGCFFSINYTIPSAIACIEKKKTGISNPAMYFAIQGLISGVATAISTGLVWVNLRAHKLITLMPLIVIIGGLVSLFIAIILPKEINSITKVEE